MSKESLRKLGHEIVEFYLIVIVRSERALKAYNLVPLNDYLSTFSNLLKHFSDSRYDVSEGDLLDSAVTDKLISTYRQLELAASQLKLKHKAIFVPNHADDYLIRIVSLIRSLLQLLEEMYDQIQRAIGDGSHRSLKIVTRHHGLLSQKSWLNDDSADIQGEISIAVYLDTDSVELQENAITAVEKFTYELGYGQYGNSQTEAGPIFKTWWAKVTKGLTSLEAQARLERLEAYAETYLGERISSINSTEAAALKEIVTAISDIPNATLRVGSILVVKYTGRNGTILHSHPLSVLEIRVLERYPEIQRDPLKLLELLGNALAMDYENPGKYDGQDAPPEIGA